MCVEKRRGWHSPTLGEPQPYHAYPLAPCSIPKNPYLVSCTMGRTRKKQWKIEDILERRLADLLGFVWKDHEVPNPGEDSHVAVRYYQRH